MAGREGFPDKSAAWTKNGFLEAVKLLLSEKNTLFESLMEKLIDYPGLEKTLYSVLFSGDSIVYSPFDASIDMALMFGFFKKNNGTVVIANRIFETILYDFFLTARDSQQNGIFKVAAQNKNQFIHDSHLDMELVLKKFVEHFDSIYGDHPEEFDEEEGIIELKVWRGNAYHERGEQQLSDYLDYFHLQKGYMLSYNFNQKKNTGIKTLTIGDRLLVEAVV